MSGESPRKPRRFSDSYTRSAKIRKSASPRNLILEIENGLGKKQEGGSGRKMLFSDKMQKNSQQDLICNADNEINVAAITSNISILEEELNTLNCNNPCCEELSQDTHTSGPPTPTNSSGKNYLADINALAANTASEPATVSGLYQLPIISSWTAPTSRPRSPAQVYMVTTADCSEVKHETNQVSWSLHAIAENNGTASLPAVLSKANPIAETGALD